MIIYKSGKVGYREKSREKSRVEVALFEPEIVTFFSILVEVEIFIRQFVTFLKYS